MVVSVGEISVIISDSANLKAGDIYIIAGVIMKSKTDYNYTSLPVNKVAATIGKRLDINTPLLVGINIEIELKSDETGELITEDTPEGKVIYFNN